MLICWPETAFLVVWPPMDIRQLRNFVAVAEQGNISQVAKKIHLTQSAYSKPGSHQRPDKIPTDSGCRLIVPGSSLRQVRDHSENGSFMGRIGYHASHERFAPSRLLENVKQAEAAGFQAAMCSDHFHPWSEQQGQSGFTWSWLGAAMASTNLSFGTVSARIWKMCREMNEMWSFSQCAMAWMRVVPNRERGLELVKMEFRSFLGAILL